MAKAHEANLAIWDALSKTDPSHTKPFQRAGGFKGTAIKPIYTEQKMTEVFGPVGTGWGFSEPQFQLVNASDGQVAVYCWLTIWYAQGGKRSEPVPGVGGDVAVKKFKDGTIAINDEAFKAAFTDAIGNSMKHLGMSADVHMGFFDDSKYVSERRREEAEEAAAEQREQAPRDTRPAPAAPQRQAGSISDRAAAPRVSSGPQRQPPADDNPFAPTEAEIAGYVAKFQTDCEACETIADIERLWKSEAKRRFELGVAKGEHFVELASIAEAREAAIAAMSTGLIAAE